MKTKKMGRPPLPKEQVRSVRITFRVTAALRKALEKRAKQERESLGKYIAGVLQSTIERGE
jgi:predicted HicB family RNase H-like nuclease